MPGLVGRDLQAGGMRILSVLSASHENNRNATTHGVSLLTWISDAGSTPAASTNLTCFIFIDIANLVDLRTLFVLHSDDAYLVPKASCDV